MYVLQPMFGNEQQLQRGKDYIMKDKDKDKLLSKVLESIMDSSSTADMFKKKRKKNKVIKVIKINLGDYEDDAEEQDKSDKKTRSRLALKVKE